MHRRPSERHRHQHVGAGYPHRVAGRHPHAAGVEPERGRGRYTVANQVIARLTGGRSTSSRRACRRDRRCQRVRDRSVGTERVGRALRPARTGAPARHPHAGSFSNGQPIGSGTTRTLPIAGHAGVPPWGVLAVAVNVTATQTQAPGYVTAWPANTVIPDVLGQLRHRMAFGAEPRRRGTQRRRGDVLQPRGHPPARRRDGLLARRRSTRPAGRSCRSTPSPAVDHDCPRASAPHAFLYEAVVTTLRTVEPVRTDRLRRQRSARRQAMLDQMNLAIAAVEKATGLDFVYGGPTTAGHDFRPPPGPMP